MGSPYLSEHAANEIYRDADTLSRLLEIVGEDTASEFTEVGGIHQGQRRATIGQTECGRK